MSALEQSTTFGTRAPLCLSAIAAVANVTRSSIRLVWKSLRPSRPVLQSRFKLPIRRGAQNVASMADRRVMEKDLAMRNTRILPRQQGIEKMYREVLSCKERKEFALVLRIGCIGT